ncbi:tRNA pseudouridine32 synthase / 23S rRNA pseudouridine746 synthase [Pseudoalteromonas sp. BSi20429]|nr:tRNA pseudouridine32 synthase / 23S rRNA pseudouridine746 synthase [Pseudoalteromonas sp. BSi20429]
MAEFWWGAAPKSAIRQHKNYYPSCYSKCQPILGHMLKGLNVEDNPLLINPAQGKDLSIVYKDDDLLVVNKPAEFLSVPGVNIDDSVYMRIKTQFPEASGPLIVHRLDMSTSGLLMIALNKRVHKALQKQFIERTIDKRYVALVNGNVAEDSGVIDLPLVLDFDDKPRQMVCYTHGKPSLTTWQVLERNNNITRLQLYPKTGRTHQLRVHCAHSLGLNMPIIGDTHYGQKADRLHLHAEYLAFTHPITLKRLEFEVAADF